MKINSIRDERVFHARQLATSKGRLEYQELLLEGGEQLLWALKAGVQILQVFVHDKITQHF